MKTFFISLLTLTLLAAAVFTRPSAASFRDFVTGAESRVAPSVALPGPAGGAISGSDAQHYLDGCTVSDRILWVDVSRDGKTIYTGAFGHWFGHAAAAPHGDGRLAPAAAN